MRKAQLCMLGILVEIDKICRRHNIPYWLDSGTLIGAVRHGGFIPWDDDVDICVLGKDYPRLREALLAELPERYQLSDLVSDKYFFETNARVKDTYSYCHFPLFVKQQSQGVWVDIILQVPAVPHRYKSFVEEIYGRAFREIHHLSVIQGKPRWRCIFNRFVAYCLYPFARFLTYLGDVWAQRHNEGVLMYTWGNYISSRRYIQDIFPLSEIQFEGHSFLAPHDTDTYLRRIYGDYMQVPDEAHRVTHMDVNSLRFSNTKIQ